MNELSDCPCPMSEEQATAFLETIKSNIELQNAIKQAADVDAIVAIAKAEGFNMTTEDLQKAQSELVDAELEAAAGGINQICEQGSENYVNKGYGY